MDIEFLINNLPTEPSERHIENMYYECPAEMDEIKQSYCLFSRDIVVKNETPFTECFGFDGEDIQTGYGAKCICTACGAEFIAGYHNSSGYMDSGIYITLNDCGVFYAGYVGKNDENAFLVKEQQTFDCPFCSEQIQLRKKSDLSYKSEEVFAVRTQQIINIGKYTAVVTWQFQSELSPDGTQTYFKEPYSAVVIDEGGTLHKFYWCGSWGEVCIDEDDSFPETVDDFQSTYRDDNSIDDTKLGGFLDDEVPSLAGTTGEKTGLAEYIECAGHFPVVYLQNWEKHRNIENLQKSYFGLTLAKCIDSIVERNIDYGNFPTGFISDFEEINFHESKPHKMLGINKQELKTFENLSWDIEEFENYARVKERVTLSEYEQIVRKYGQVQTVRYFKESLFFSGFMTFKRIQFYLNKQKMDNREGMEMFLDYFLALNNPQTREVVFPPNLQQAHDNQTKQIEYAKNSKFTDAFISVKKRYSELEWNDGKYCVILPASPKELIDEGDVLHHCVGNYCERHSKGKNIILFVRKYRRPERSFYTLNISFEHGKPVEIQFHGYGNERHGENKQYKHSIPKDVREFVDRWKLEVLKPWHIAQTKKEKQSKKSA